MEQQKQIEAFRPILYGAGLGFLIASFIVIMITTNSTVITPSMFLPLLTVSIAGAAGGLVFHISRPYRHQKGSIGLIAFIFSMLVFFIGIWLSLVAALAVIGLWD